MDLVLPTIKSLDLRFVGMQPGVSKCHRESVFETTNGHSMQAGSSRLLACSCCCGTTHWYLMHCKKLF